MGHDVQIEFDKRLRKLRIYRRWSQLKLETLAGLSPGSVSRIENRKTNPSKETLLKIAEVMQLNLGECIYLFGIDCLQRVGQQSLSIRIPIKD